MNKRVFFGECMVELAQTAPGQYQQTFAGDTFNSAIYLKRLNGLQQVSYLTAVGQDTLSQGLLDLMHDEGLDTDLVQRCSDRTLGLYMVATDARGERSFSYWRDQSAAKQTLSLLQRQGGAQLLSGTDSFFFSGISLGILSDEDRRELMALLTTLKGQGCQIIFDPNYRPRLWQSQEQAKYWTDKAYAMADLAFPGGDDHLTLYGHNSVTDILNHVQGLGVTEIVLKNGIEGVQVVTPGNHCIVPTFQVDTVVDTTAAGDAFNGGYLAARFAGLSPADAAQQGAKTAAFVLGFRGAIVPREAFLTQQRKVV